MIKGFVEIHGYQKPCESTAHQAFALESVKTAPRCPGCGMRFGAVALRCVLPSKMRVDKPYPCTLQILKKKGIVFTGKPTVSFYPDPFVDGSVEGKPTDRDQFVLTLRLKDDLGAPKSLYIKVRYQIRMDGFPEETIEDWFEFSVAGQEANDGGNVYNVYTGPNSILIDSVIQNTDSSTQTDLLGNELAFSKRIRRVRASQLDSHLREWIDSGKSELLEQMFELGLGTDPKNYLADRLDFFRIERGETRPLARNFVLRLAALTYLRRANLLFEKRSFPQASSCFIVARNLNKQLPVEDTIAADLTLAEDAVSHLKTLADPEEISGFVEAYTFLHRVEPVLSEQRKGFELLNEASENDLILEPRARNWSSIPVTRPDLPEQPVPPAPHGQTSGWKPWLLLVALLTVFAALVVRQTSGSISAPILAPPPVVTQPVKRASLGTGGVVPAQPEILKSDPHETSRLNKAFDQAYKRKDFAAMQEHLIRLKGLGFDDDFKRSAMKSLRDEIKKTESSKKRRLDESAQARKKFRQAQQADDLPRAQAQMAVLERLGKATSADRRRIAHMETALREDQQKNKNREKIAIYRETFRNAAKVKDVDYAGQILKRLERLTADTSAEQLAYKDLVQTVKREDKAELERQAEIARLEQQIIRSVQLGDADRLEAQIRRLESLDVDAGSHRYQLQKLLMDLGTELYKRGEHDQALTYYGRVLDWNPSSVTALYNQAIVHNSKQEYRQAINLASHVLQLEADHAGAFMVRAYAKYDLADFEGTVSDARKALEANPRSAQVYNIKALAHYELGQVPIALRNFVKALEVDPNFALAYFNRAVIRQRIGDRKGADRDFKAACRLESKFCNRDRRP